MDNLKPYPFCGNEMEIEKLVERLRQYSFELIAYKLGADFADACENAADILQSLSKSRKRMNDDTDDIHDPGL